MAGENNQIQKVYDVSLLGSQAALDNLDRINNAFIAIKKNKLALNNTAKINTTDDSKAVKDLTDKLEALKIKEKELQIEYKAASVQAKLMQIARQQEAAQAKSMAAGNEFLAGSYTDVAKQYKALLAIAKNSTNVFNSVEVAAAARELKVLKDQLDNFNRSLTSDGTLIGEYTRGVVNAFRRMGLDDIIRNQVTGSKQALAGLNSEFEQLRAEFAAVKNSGGAGLETIEKLLIENRQAANQLETQINEVQVALHGTGTIGEQITTGLSAGFQGLKRDIVSMLVSYIGFQAVIQGFISSLDTVKELSDQTTNLEIEFGKAKGGVDNLTDSLAQLNTRTKLTVLENIANIAARAGVTEDRLIGVTAAIDKIKIAFGKDFGDVEEGTEALVKLVNIFEGSGNVTGENLLRTGNSIRVLANESVASVPFLTDFTKRMAGLKAIFDLTLPSTLGLASGFEQFGASAEVSSSALVKILPKLATDTEKYAKIAGITQQAFATLLKDDPTEALLKLSEGLVKGKGDIEAISQAFSDSELGKGRISTILAILGENAGTFRLAIKDAGEAFENTSNIEDAFSKKNENLAATLDKISKKFDDAANNKTFVEAISAISNAILLIITNLPALIGLLGVLAAGWLFNQIALGKLNLEIAAYNFLIVRNRVYLGALTLAQGLYNALMIASSVAITIANRALSIFNISIKATPLGLILTALALLAGAFAAFGDTLDRTREKITQNSRELQILKDAQNEANIKLQETITKEKVYISLLKDKNVSQATQKAALKDLINLSPQYLSGLTAQNVLTQKGTDLLRAYNDQLRTSLTLEAASLRAKQESEALIRLITLRNKAEFAIASGGGVNAGEISGDILDQIADQTSFSFLNSLVLNLLAKPFDKKLTDPDDLKKLVDVLNKQIQAQTKNDTAAQAALKKTFEDDQIAKRKALQQNIFTLEQTLFNLKEGTADYAKTLKALNEARKSLAEATGEAITGGLDGDGTAGGERTVAAIRSDLKKIKKEIESATGEERAALEKRRNELQAELNTALGKATGGASAISGAVKDQFKLIEEAQKDQLVSLETAFQEEDKTRKEFNGKFIGDESTYLREKQLINDAAIGAKLSKLRGSNAEERRLAAELRLQLLIERKKTNDELYKLDLERLQAQKENDLSLAKSNLDKTEEDITVNPAVKAAARANYFTTVLAIQEQFNKDANALELAYNKASEKNAADREKELVKVNREVSQALNESVKASNENEIQEIEDQYLAAVDAIRKKIALKAQNVTDTTSNPAKRLADLKKLQTQQAQELLNADNIRIKRELDQYKFELENKLISQKEYNDKAAKLEEQLTANKQKQYELDTKNFKIGNEQKRRIEETVVK